MPRFYFHLHEQHGVLTDDEGLDLPNAAAVRRHALVGARSIISGDVGSGTLDLSPAVEVTDERGTWVLTLPFIEAVTLRLPAGAAPSSGRANR